MFLLLLSYSACSNAVETETSELPGLYTVEIMGCLNTLAWGHFASDMVHFISHILSDINNIHFFFLREGSIKQTVFADMQE